jgi:hypothetical protein
VPPTWSIFELELALAFIGKLNVNAETNNTKTIPVTNPLLMMCPIVSFPLLISIDLKF